MERTWKRVSAASTFRQSLPVFATKPVQHEGSSDFQQLSVGVETSTKKWSERNKTHA